MFRILADFAAQGFSRGEICAGTNPAIDAFKQISCSNIICCSASQMRICLSKSSARLTNPGDMSAVIGFWSGIKGVYRCRLTTLDHDSKRYFIPPLIKYKLNDFQKCDFQGSDFTRGFFLASSNLKISLLNDFYEYPRGGRIFVTRFPEIRIIINILLR